MRWSSRSSQTAVLTTAILVTSTAAGQSPGSPRELFEQNVLPILELHCHYCHGESTRRSELDLRSQESILKGGLRGPSVAPGNARASLLYQLISHAQEPNMPMGGAKLADRDIARIAEWINSLPASEDNSVGPGGPTASGRTAPAGTTQTVRKSWSFQKPARPDVPEVKNASWVRNEIDAFILRRLEERGLSPSPPAEPLALLRRLFFDLTGLPPSPEEIDLFLKDGSERAYENVVDRLLSSPHYGERWGRHWLDLARYADSGGFEFDYDRPHAWRYRDYVIRSFNEDKPYDRFIREQLAGDELEPDNPYAGIPTGFLRNGPTVDNASNEQTRMDELDDMVSTTSSVFLGLTIGCARCHDHKYDPISQKDYYRLQAVFIPSQKTDRLLADPSGEESFKTANKEIDEKVNPHREKLAAIEKPHRGKLLEEKVDFFMRLAERSGALAGRDREEYRNSLAGQFARDVKLQPEEIEARLPPEQARERRELLAEVERLNKTRPKPPPTAMGVSDKLELSKCFVLLRGDFRQKGEEVQPGLPSFFGAATIESPAPGARSTYRRKQLADWIASADNPLTARVAVNRIWQYHFGKGIVRTASDFGANADGPSHPELLDWLATEFVARGWSFKAMHRLILTSNTYRQSSRFNGTGAQVDPGNRLLWRMNPRRMESEVIRDSILAASGRLNREMGGPGIYPRIDPAVISTGSTHKWPADVKEGPREWRRSVYIFVKRSVLVPLLEVFDCPDPTVSSPARASSITAPQALALLNNAFVLEQAGYFAQRLYREAGADERSQVAHAFKLALGRRPNERELEMALVFLARQAKAHQAGRNSEEGPGNGGAALPAGLKAARYAALRDFCHMLFNLNEFVYAD